jgi:hypothetical protein
MRAGDDIAADLGAIGFAKRPSISPRFLDESCERYRNGKSEAFSIWIVTPDSYTFSRCFEEVAFSLQCAFRELGFKVPVVTRPEETTGTVIVLGPHLLSKINQQSIPETIVLFNLEQVYLDSPWITPEYIELAKNHLLWDYSERNLAQWSALGVHCAALCEIGYVPELNRIGGALNRDIDVTFVGCLNDRRRMILDDLQKHNVNLYWLFDVWGQQRDEVIARSKILLNFHMYEAKVFEIVRVSYLLANSCCVVSEIGSDVGAEDPLSGGIAFTDYSDLVACCMRLLANSEEQSRLRSEGFRLIQERDQVRLLQNALGSSYLLG